MKYWQHITGLAVVAYGATCRTDGFSVFSKKGKVLDVPRWERREGIPGRWKGKKEGMFSAFLGRLEPRNLFLKNLGKHKHSTL